MVDIPEVTRAQAGDPRTFLILGSDARYTDRSTASSRARTRSCSSVDPDSKRIAVLSIPRDLKVKIPATARTRSTCLRVRRAAQDRGHDQAALPGRHRRGLPDQQRINVNFGGFRRAVNYVGGVYVDVDRRYYNDNTTAGRRPLRDDRHPARLPEAQAARTRSTTSATATATTTSSAPRASRTSCARSPTRTACAGCWTWASASGSRASSAATSRSTSPSCRSRTSSGCCRWACSWPTARAGQRGPLPGPRGQNPAVDTYLYGKAADLRRPTTSS